MTQVNVTGLRQFAITDIIKVLQAFVLTLFILLVTATVVNGQCDMGGAYSYTDTWSMGGEIDTNGDGEPDYNHLAPKNRLSAVGEGVVENDYNTCGHEYYSNVTITGPRGGVGYGVDMALIDMETEGEGEYYAQSMLYYYCPIAGRDFVSGSSSNSIIFEVGTDIFYKHTRTLVTGYPPVKGCTYRACSFEDTNRDCFKVEYTDLVNPEYNCVPGLNVGFARVSFPVLGFRYCAELYHHDLLHNPCLTGTH